MEWYQKDEPHDPAEIEKLFKKSLSLNPNDAFTHCWYGTFLKEMRGDWLGAEREYQEALKLANSSTYIRDRDHPLILNNIALLLLDGVQDQRIPSEKLLDAWKLLTYACQRVKELESEFYWPKQSLDLCEMLMQVHGISEPHSSD